MSSPFGPGILPTNNPSSCWQQSVAEDPLSTWGQHDALPETSDIVIIGSGLSGARIAHALLHSKSRPKTVTVLDARQICSGASGRNAGHCRPDAFRGYNAYSKHAGAEQAKKVLEHEAITFGKVASFVKEHNVDCEFTLRPTLDLCMSPDFEVYARKAYEDARAAGVNVDHVKILTPDEAKKLGRTEMATMGYQWNAATLNPIKLAYNVYRQCLAQEGFKLFSYAPVISVTDTDGPFPWLVTTPRGKIAASKVVYATNGYTSLLLEEMKDLIWPFRGQAIQLSPPPLGLEVFPRVEPSISLRYRLQYYYSVASRPSNQIVLATPRICNPLSAQDYEDLFDMDDSQPSLVRSKDTFDHFAKAFTGGGYDSTTTQPGEGGFDRQWCGILGLTPDTLPFVGPLPGKEGRYIMAGFNGHGMARIFHCGPCLADVILHGMSHWDPTVPECFQVTPERLSRLAQKIPQGVSVAEKANATAFSY